MAGVVTIEIAGQRYPIRSTLDPTYVAELAAYVERKMRAASEAAPMSDAVGLAILVALNITDELFRARDKQFSTDGEFNERALRLSQLVDDVLTQVASTTTPNVP